MAIKATLVLGAFTRLRFAVSRDGATWHFPVAFDGERAIVGHPELVDDGTEPGYIRASGYVEPPPKTDVQAAVEEAIRRLWDTQMQIVLRAGGVTKPPGARKSSAGAPKTLTRTHLAARARRILQDPHSRATGEKTLTLARQALVLDGNDFTKLGRARLRQVDRARRRLLHRLEPGVVARVTELADVLNGMKPEVVNAALDDLIDDRLIRVVRKSTATERSLHQLRYAELARR